ncbi:MAG: hypothetical protein QW760_04565 [Thermofilaceae archaeon]
MNLKLEPGELKILKVFLECGSIRAAARKLESSCLHSIEKCGIKVSEEGLVNYARTRF